MLGTSKPHPHMRGLVMGGHQVQCEPFSEPFFSEEWHSASKNRGVNPVGSESLWGLR